VLLNVHKNTNSADLSSTVSDHLKNSYRVVDSRTHPRGGGGGLPGCSPPKPPKIKKKTDFVDIMISKVLREFPVSRNQPLKSADDSTLEF
jgi:hypothetical protein